MLAHNFALRTWIIEHLGPDTDPDWDPESLAADTLAALTLDPTQLARYPQAGATSRSSRSASYADTKP
ncbi:hypothetical protein [Phytohabitans kaempferiae]|uniref:Uncharacterized protein n=1 Tax=Phytohabitans kaempferiae TaxID=1620943 RepID=A0ABV6MBH7_9ACTN